MEAELLLCNSIIWMPFEAAICDLKYYQNYHYQTKMYYLLESDDHIEFYIPVMKYVRKDKSLAIARLLFKRFHSTPENLVGLW